jgi:hypothetical protein
VCPEHGDYSPSLREADTRSGDLYWPSPDDSPAARDAEYLPGSPTPARLTEARDGVLWAAPRRRSWENRQMEPPSETLSWSFVSVRSDVERVVDPDGVTLRGQISITRDTKVDALAAAAVAVDGLKDVRWSIRHGDVASDLCHDC